MEKTIFEKLIDFGILGILVFVMAFIIYHYWKKDRQEKERLIERLEDCNDKIKELTKKED